MQQSDDSDQGPPPNHERGNWRNGVLEAVGEAPQSRVLKLTGGPREQRLVRKRGGDSTPMGRPAPALNLPPLEVRLAQGP